MKSRSPVLRKALAGDSFFCFQCALLHIALSTFIVLIFARRLSSLGVIREDDGGGSLIEGEVAVEKGIKMPGNKAPVAFLR